MNCPMAAIRSLRTSSSADGVEKRASSWVMTQMTATFAHGTVIVSKASLLTGLLNPSPTQFAVAPAVCRGNLDVERNRLEPGQASEDGNRPQQLDEFVPSWSDS